MLLHGYLETLYIFEEFAKLLEPYFRVISIDLPGHGLSGSDNEINSISFSAGVVADVLDTCKVESAFVAGHSMGGYVAQRCIIEHCNKFKGLVLLNSTPFADTPEKVQDRMREIDAISAGKLLQLASLSIPKMYASDNLRRFDEKIQETLEICEMHDPEGIVACLRGMAERTCNTEPLEEYSPVLLVFGDSDKFISVERAQEIGKSWPAAKSVMLPVCGHNSFIEQPEAVVDAILSFANIRVEAE